MPVQIIDGDLFQTHAKYICHQVNCQARMGSGVAKQVRAKYPEVYNAYVGFCNEERNAFGQTQFVQAKSLSICLRRATTDMMGNCTQITPHFRAA